MDYMSEFQSRRRTAWRRSLPWIVGGIVLSLTVMLGSSHPKSLWQYYSSELVLSLLWLSVVVRFGYIAEEHIRCPKCKRSIWIVAGEYALDPAVCPKCGIALK
jgi:hypothetical protein